MSTFKEDAGALTGTATDANAPEQVVMAGTSRRHWPEAAQPQQEPTPQQEVNLVRANRDANRRGWNAAAEARRDFTLAEMVGMAGAVEAERVDLEAQLREARRGLDEGRQRLTRAEQAHARAVEAVAGRRAEETQAKARLEEQARASIDGGKRSDLGKAQAAVDSAAAGVAGAESALRLYASLLDENRRAVEGSQAAVEHLGEDHTDLENRRAAVAVATTAAPIVEEVRAKLAPLVRRWQAAGRVHKFNPITAITAAINAALTEGNKE